MQLVVYDHKIIIVLFLTRHVLSNRSRRTWLITHVILYTHILGNRRRTKGRFDEKHEMLNLTLKRVFSHWKPYIYNYTARTSSNAENPLSIYFIIFIINIWVYLIAVEVIKHAYKYHITGFVTMIKSGILYIFISYLFA